MFFGLRISRKFVWCFLKTKNRQRCMCFLLTRQYQIIWTSLLRAHSLNQNISIFRFSNEWFGSDEWISFQPLDRANILKSNIVDIRLFLERYSYATRMHCWICKQEKPCTEQMHLQRKISQRDERRDPNTDYTMKSELKTGWKWWTQSNLVAVRK